MEIGDNIVLPALIGRFEKYRCGSIKHFINGSTTTRIGNHSLVQYFGRQRDELLELNNGEKIIVTKRKIRNIPEESDVSGVLFSNGDTFKWLWHRSLIDYFHENSPNTPAKIQKEWIHKFQFKQEIIDSEGEVISIGLRPPQIGALHAIGAHWSISNQPATIVMPTGTGKTETMLATLVNYIDGCLLIVVPSRALREQISQKFLNLGLLRMLGNLPLGIPNPIVGILRRRPADQTDLEIFDRCNVVITTINTIAQGSTTQFIDKIVEKCSCLILDEAHHVAADSWNLIRDAFKDKKVLQFTATPFRRDGKPVDGKVIYSYPLAKAQTDGYFKHINFKPVFEMREDQKDLVIAVEGVNFLNQDLEKGYDHILMARCSSIERAEEVFIVYRNIASIHNPIIVHSDSIGKNHLLEKIQNRESRIVVCVDMLGEGFDLPQLKIATVHDTHKSLAVLLQFVGRFTRTSGSSLGNATVIANIANQNVTEALERLYSEDADWNTLLSEYASEAVKEHAEMVEFLQNSERVYSSELIAEQEALSPKMLYPKFSTAIFKCEQFNPRRFHEGLDKNLAVRGAWFNEKNNALYFVTESQIKVNWSRLKSTFDQKWDLYILYYNSEMKLLFIHSSDKNSLHQELANAVSSNSSILQMGDAVFRSLVGISRLVFQNIGLKKPGRRNLRYSMYTGADVAQALSPAQKATSTKSNVYGGGYENGMPVSIGCSYKGRIWSKDQGPIFLFIKWCDRIGEKVINTEINTDEIIDNVLIPVVVEEVPDKEVLAIDWPIELLQRTEESIRVTTLQREASFSNYSIEFVEINKEKGYIVFSVVFDENATKYAICLGPGGYEVKMLSGEGLFIKVGKLVSSLEEWFQEYPPNVLFVDGSELDGNLLIEPKQKDGITFPKAHFEAWNWDGTDITKESQWKQNVVRTNSIQYRVLQEFSKRGYKVVIDDDDSGEAADVICINENEDKISVALIHCKFSGGERSGQRVKDVMEVCGQASRSVKWAWKFQDLCKHISNRESARGRRGRATRFFNGRLGDVIHYSKLSRFKPVEFEVYAVQPGLSKGQMTEEQMNILSSAYGYILEITGIQLRMICSE